MVNIIDDLYKLLFKVRFKDVGENGYVPYVDDPTNKLVKGKIPHIPVVVYRPSLIAPTGEVSLPNVNRMTNMAIWTGATDQKEKHVRSLVQLVKSRRRLFKTSGGRSRSRGASM